MVANWLDAADIEGIPAAFIINREGKVAWIGLPLEMDQALAEIISNTYDLPKAIAEAGKAAAVKQALRDVTVAVKAGEFDKAVQQADLAMRAYPDTARKLIMVKFDVLLRRKGDYAAAAKIGDQV